MSHLLILLLVSQLPNFDLVSTVPTTKSLRIPQSSLVRKDPVVVTKTKKVVTGDSLRAAGSKSLKDWLKKYGSRYPYVGINGMPAQYHLVNHHGFKTSVVDKLNDKEKTQLHNAAHAIDRIPPRSFTQKSRNFNVRNKRLLTGR